ncbi:MAG TPA: M12 family metallo-peptidase [Candidatus Kapabacteria bacterium]|jgi:hypothetical protein|nr:M12 family metallo-peptidase [Candidatus Kapabacteria bacterium]
MLRVTRNVAFFALFAASCVFTAESGIGATRIVSAREFLIASEPPQGGPAIESSYFFVDSIALNEALRVGGQLELTDFPGNLGDSKNSESSVLTLDLKPAHSPIDQSTQFWEGTSAGDRPIAAPRFFAYRGKVLGEPHSRVILTVFGSKLFCSIVRETGESYVFGPAKLQSDSHVHVLMQESRLLAMSPLGPINCFEDALSQPHPLIPIQELLHRNLLQSFSEGSSPLSASTLLQTDIAVEADSCFFHNAGGNMGTVLGYIASLFAMSSTIYEDEANITWHLTWVKVWTNADPYKVNGDAYSLEDTVPHYWKLHYADVPRDLAHVMTSVSYGGGGYGWFSLCDTNWSYSVSSPQTGHQYPTFAFTYDAYIVAHEIGHNFSLPHSHNCYWDPPIDTCYTNDDTVHHLQLADACYGLPITPRRNPGTIMSYCANANYALSGNDFTQFKLALTFSPKVDSVLRVNAEQAPCITPPATPIVIFLSPRGSETYPGDTTIAIKWSFAHVSNVSLEYSSDGGNSWKPIANGVAATLGMYSWVIPNITSKKMLVKIADDADPSVADTSLLFFSVAPTANIDNAEPGNTTFSISLEPVTHILIVHSSEIMRIRWEIANDRGIIVLSGNGTNTSLESNIHLDGLAAGAYFLRITSPTSSILPFTYLP